MDGITKLSSVARVYEMIHSLNPSFCREDRSHMDGLARVIPALRDIPGDNFMHMTLSTNHQGCSMCFKDISGVQALEFLN